ncbi:MAG: DUF6273 domain-containing protein [Peptococcaceae bacterium]|nr:DUF6273 domain-containing protein [Peptococcaceae bacterium]
MGEGLRVLSHLEDTTDEKIDAIARDVNVQLNQGVNNLDAKADKLVKDVKAETAEMRKIIESAEFGIPAPSLASMTAVSDEAGINVTVTATDATVDYSSNKAVLATTKGVMVRYKDGSYPTTKTDGELAFIDDDLFTIDANGSRVAKAKTHLVVGLTKDHTYCFSAFPYTQQGAHNERLGTGNVAKCKWVGNLTTLTINVGRDVEIFDLGEVTATLAPTTSGTPLVQKRTGDGTIVFAGVKAGEYILSFSSVANHKTPSALSVTLQGGIPKVLSVQYVMSKKSLQNYSWAEIDTISKTGKASEFFSIGDTIDTTINGQPLTLQIYGFNHDQLSDDSGMAGITFGTKDLTYETKCWHDSYNFETINGNTGSGFTGSSIYAWLNTEMPTQLPEDLRKVVKSVQKKCYQSVSMDAGNPINFSMKFFLLSSKEVGANFGEEGTAYPIFTNDSSRVKLSDNGSGTAELWVLRTWHTYGDAKYPWVGYVSNQGSCSSYVHPSPERHVCFAFCV